MHGYTHTSIKNINLYTNAYINKNGRIYIHTVKRLLVMVIFGG